MKKSVSILLSAALALTCLTGCGSAGSDTPAGSSAEVSLAKGSYTIGISQFAEHASLDNCREGFLKGLESEGIVEGRNLTVDYRNAQADTGEASQIADSFINMENIDLIAAIATPSAQSAYNASINTDIPVVYTAVTDPAAAGLANEDGTGTGSVTGSSDVPPVTDQLQMIRSIMPAAETIGILYSTGEANSVSAIKTYEVLAPDYGFEIISIGINDFSDIDLAAASLVTQTDCLCNLTDNTVTEALRTVLDKASEQGIPVFGSEAEQVKRGCVAAMGIDYYDLGFQTGVMAAEILKGETAAQDMPFITDRRAELSVNTAAAEQIGLTISDSFIAGASEVFDEIIDS